LTRYANKYTGEHTPARITIEDLFKKKGTGKKGEERVKAEEANDVWTVDSKGGWGGP
jgi:hypothetical protein